LSETVPIPVRTLALNQIDDNKAPPANTGLSAYMPDLIQFGLPPEDEARLVAGRAILEGYSKVLIITSADEYGQRIHKAFSERWEELGGRTLEEIHYSPQTGDFITPVKELLNINNSEARINALQQRLGRNITAATRVRQDPDFVFMVASNLNARQIVPHLRFFRAESVPVYTISHVYTGRANLQTGRDLEGVEFVDMPWILNPDQTYSAPGSMSFPRYYAFGVDAFSLIPRIGELFLGRDYRFPGKTGDIYITNDGIVHRLLPWARFADGEVQQINTGNIH
ncbi:MAG: penicillin-binding protein activator, partial [Gammaproteobacteria bacterium]